MMCHPVCCGALEIGHSQMSESEHFAKEADVWATLKGLIVINQVGKGRSEKMHACLKMFRELQVIEFKWRNNTTGSWGQITKDLIY